MTSSADFAKKATVSFDQWCAYMNLRGTAYDYRNTYWYKAGKALEEETHPPKPPAPTPSALGQRCVYMSTVTDEAINHFTTLCQGTPHGWYTILFSADLNEALPGHVYYVTEAQLIACAKYARTASWCDSSATPTSHAVQLAHTRNMDFASGQFEDDAQYAEMSASGVPLAIGNPNNLSAANLATAKTRQQAGLTAFIGECLEPNPAYSAQGLNIASVCFYVDRDEDKGGYLPLSAYAGHPAGQRRSCSVYTGGAMRPEDWALYREWTKP